MSIAGYFCRRGHTELRMPGSGESGDDLGIRFEGPVLTGEKSVEQQQRDVAIRATSYLGETVEAYDTL